MTDASHTHSQAAKNTRGSMMVSNVLAIVGSIILIIIIIWGLIHLFQISGWFSGGKANTKIEVTAPANAIAGQPAHISWKYTTKEKGSYALLYPCIDGAKLAAPGGNNQFFALPCGSAFTLGQATSTIVVLPVLSGTSTARVPLTILFMPAATGTQAQGTATMTIHANGSNPTPIATSTPEKPVVKPDPKPTTPATPAITGPADLAVSITSMTMDQFGNGTVTFNISNIGGSTAGSYTFTAQLPTMQPYTYVSPAQAPLSPGSYIVNTLRFTQAAPGNVFIAVDPYNAVSERSETNNTASQFLGGGYRY